MPELKRLRIGSDPGLAYPADVARLRAVLNDRGFDAEPSEIERAYSGWCAEHHGVTWLPVARKSDAALFGALMGEFVEDESPDPGPPAPGPARTYDVPLTARQKAILEAIESSIRRRGYPPTVREIGDALDIKSPNGVMCHLKALQRKGYIVRESMASRAIRLTSGAEARS